MNYILYLMGLIAIIYAISGGINSSYHIQRDIVAPFERAQVSATADNMLKYIQQGKAALEMKGWTSGHTAYVFKTETTDMALVYESIIGLEDRLKLINSMEPASMEYQSGMDDCRGIIRELLGYEETAVSHLSSSTLLWRFGGGAGYLIWGLVGGFLFLLGGIAGAVIHPGPFRA